LRMELGIGRIVRVHEDAAELLDGGYGAVVDGLDPMEEYKFAGDMYIYICIYIHTYICIYIYTCVCVCINIILCVYIYT